MLFRSAARHRNEEQELKGKRNPLTEKEVEKVRQLLMTTELTLRDIARRFSVSEIVIRKVNQKYNVRIYNGRKRHWSVAA